MKKVFSILCAVIFLAGLLPSTSQSSEWEKYIKFSPLIFSKHNEGGYTKNDGTEVEYNTNHFGSFALQGITKKEDSRWGIGLTGVYISKDSHNEPAYMLGPTFTYQLLEWHVNVDVVVSIGYGEKYLGRPDRNEKHRGILGYYTLSFTKWFEKDFYGISGISTDVSHVPFVGDPLNILGLSIVHKF